VTLDNPKLHPLPAAVTWREQQRAAGRRVVLTNGVFDLLHTGHLYYLKKARELGDALVIALNAEERAALESIPAEIRFLPFLPGFSTTELIARIRAAGEI